VRSLGKTGIFVSPLGVGGGPLGAADVDERSVRALIDAALSLDFNVIDTAPSYGESEARIGRALEGRRDGVVLVTKCGYGVEGVDDWTPACIARGIDRALARLRTDRIDVMLLHSCDRDRLARGDLFAPLLDAKRAGKLRAVGYSGDGDALDFAIDCGVFDVVECSVSVVDQRALAHAVPRAVERGIGVLAKRPWANGVASHRVRPSRDDLAIYFDRWRAMFDGASISAPSFTDAIRFAAHAPGVDCALVGTSRVAHLKEAARAVALGPSADVRALRDRFDAVGGDWRGLV
jgi:aryl-alcohol dehydrogenase-like predicted oxidoreductase